MRTLSAYFCGKPEIVLVPISEEEEEQMRKVYDYPVGTAIRYCGLIGGTDDNPALNFNIGGCLHRCHGFNGIFVELWYEIQGGYFFKVTASEKTDNTNYEYSLEHTRQDVIRLHQFCVSQRSLEYVSKEVLDDLHTITLRLE